MVPLNINTHSCLSITKPTHTAEILQLGKGHWVPVTLPPHPHSQWNVLWQTQLSTDAKMANC